MAIETKYFDEAWADEQHEGKKEFLEEDEKEKEKRNLQQILKNILQSGRYGIDGVPYRKDVITMPNKDPISIVNEHTIFTFTEIDKNAVFSDDSPHCVVIEYTEFGPRPLSMNHVQSTGAFILVFPNKNMANYFVTACYDKINGHTEIEKVVEIENQKELTFALLSKIEFSSNAATNGLYEHSAHTTDNITVALQHYTIHSRGNTLSK